MSKKVIITSDSTLDLTTELLDRFGIAVIPLTILLGKESFLDSREYTPEMMYERFRADGTLPKTSAPSLQQFTDFFGGFVSNGYEIVHLDISSELSGTCNNARIAAAEFDGVYVVDSRMLSTGVALLAIEGAECRDRGMCAADIAAHLQELTAKVDTSFVLDTLEFMWKGGRCSGVAALGANLLRLKPGLEMKDGKLEIFKKYRGAIESVYRTYIKERLAGKDIRPGHVFITHAGEVSETVTDELSALVRELTGAEEIHVTTAGCTVSSHCGPKCLGVLFINK